MKAKCSHAAMIALLSSSQGSQELENQKNKRLQGRIKKPLKAEDMNKVQEVYFNSL